MFEARQALRFSALVVFGSVITTSIARAQSALEYAKRVDSLATVWRFAVAAEARDTIRANILPPDSIQVGPIIVRADSAWSALGEATAKRLAPMVAARYGGFADSLARHQFILRDKGSASAGASLASGVADSTGAVRLRSSEYATPDALFTSWKRKAELIIADEMGPSIRNWIHGAIPIDPPTSASWSDARVSLILSRTPAAAECARGAIERCSEVLGLVDVADPAFTLFDADTRRNLIAGNARILRRADAKKFDRCTVDRIEPVCDSLARSIPPDAVPAPVPPVVRQSLVRFSLMLGGRGAFDRFMRGASPKARIEAASMQSADSVVKQWRATILDSRRSSTAVDLETGTSAIVWAALCGALALRSSRWR